MKIKKCPFCGSDEIHTESATEINRHYKNGKLIFIKRIPLEKRIFCDNCSEDLNDCGVRLT